MRRLDPTIIEVIQAAPGTVEEIAARFGISPRSVARVRATRSKNRLTDDQIIEAYSSTESDRVVARQLKVSVDLITAIRTRRAYTAVTADLPDRLRSRSKDRSRAEIEAARSASAERRRRRAERDALILSSREPHSIVARALGIDPAVVCRTRRAAGWRPEPKPVKQPKPMTVKPRGVRATPRPKPKPPKAEPRIVEWKPVLSTPPVLQPEPEPPKVDVRAALKRFISGHPLLSILALGRHLDLRLPWLSIIQAMAPPGSAPTTAPRGPKQVRLAVRLKPGYLRARAPRAIVCRFYSVGDRPEPTGLGEPL